MPSTLFQVLLHLKQRHKTYIKDCLLYTSTVIVDEEGNPVGKVEDQDSVIFFNFRADRARQLTMAFMDPNFEGFDVSNRPNVDFVCMMEYVKDLDRCV